MQITGIFSAFSFFKAGLSEFQKRILGKRRETSIFILSDGLLLRVFKNLSVKDLLCVSRVCKHWYSVASDKTLWELLYLKPFYRQLGRENCELHFEKLILYRFSVVCSLDLSGFTLASSTLRLLDATCKNLRKLVLKAVKFSGSYAISLSFPERLEHLDLRFSSGSSGIYLAIGSSLSKLSWFGICDGLVYSLLKHKELEKTMKCCRKSLRTVNATECSMMDDNFVNLLCRCEYLEVLSLQNCSKVSENSVNNVIISCKSLKTLILEGTITTDYSLYRVNWEASHLYKLHLGCISFSSKSTLSIVLLQILQNPFLSCFRLCFTIENEAVLMKDILDFCSREEYEVLICLCTCTAGRKKRSNSQELKKIMSLTINCEDFNPEEEAPKMVKKNCNKIYKAMKNRFLTLNSLYYENELETAL